MKSLQFLFLFLATVCISTVAAAGEKKTESVPAHVHDHHHMMNMDSEPASGPTKVSIPDAMVLDQNNHKVHFYSDLVKGKTVVINFIFTTCTTICPPMTANFARLQKMMAEQGHKNFRLISVSVDPENDTPERLRNYAGMFHAQPGWTFVTGTRAELEPVYKAFSIYGGSKQDHSPTVVIGNDALHTWTYASGLTSADKLSQAVTAVIDKGKTATTAAAKKN